MIKYSERGNRIMAMGYEHPDGIFYRRACEMVGIDPDNNPNYKAEELPNHLQDITGNPIKITVAKPSRTIPITELFEHICNRLSND